MSRPSLGVKRLLARSVFWVGLACCLAASFEGLVRLFLRDRIVLFPRFHDAARYGPFRIRRLRAQTTFIHQSRDGRWEFRTNRQGFRSDRDYAYEKKPGVIRVLCLGDSHTLGFECGQAETYPEVIERYGRVHGCKIEAMNTGISGFGTAEQLAFLENEGWQYRPDVVVLGFYANDPDDNAKSDLFRVEQGRLATNKFEHLPGVRLLRPLNNFAPTRWLSQHSYAYSLVLNTVWERMKGRLSRKAAETVPVEYAVAQKPGSAAVQAYQEELTGLLLRRMSQCCHAHGARFYLVDIPLRESPTAFASSVPTNLTGLVTENSDRVFWSSNLFGGQPGPAGLFRPHGQMHISPLAHARIGQAVARAILADQPTSSRPSPGPE